MTLSNGALSHCPNPKRSRQADFTPSLTKPALLRMLAEGGTDGVAVEGNASVLQTLTTLTDEPDPLFNIVTS